MYKKFPIILAFLIIGGGILWLSVKPSISLFDSKIEEEKTEEVVVEETEAKDEISIFLLKLKEETSVGFGEVKESGFDWMIETEASGSGRILVSGKAINAQVVTNEVKAKIGQFFVSNNFEINAANTLSETSVSTIGHKGEEFVCLCLSRVNNKEEGLEENIVLYDVEVSCGIPDLKTFKKIENKKDDFDLSSSLLDIFSQKYEKPKDEINLTVSKNTEIHASGGISFSEEISGAMWLAFKGELGWELIFDGNGTIPCASVLPYNFPADMVSECWDEDIEKLIKL